MSDSEKTLFYCVYDLAGLSNSCTFYNAKISHQFKLAAGWG